MSPRGPRPMDDLAAPRSVSSPPGEVVDRDHGSRSPLDRLFRKRYRKRTSSAVPAITVESPVSPCVIFACCTCFSSTLLKSTTNSSHATPAHPIAQPHLLSPERKHTPLSIPDEVKVLIQGKSDNSSREDRSLPPLPELGLQTTEVLRVPDELPPGFVPLAVTPVATNYVFVDPIRTRTATPRTKYEEAPIPDGIVYPDPPGKYAGKYIPNTAPTIQFPPSPSQTPSSPQRRATKSVEQLSPLNLFSTLS